MHNLTVTRLDLCCFDPLVVGKSGIDCEVFVANHSLSRHFEWLFGSCTPSIQIADSAWCSKRFLTSAHVDDEVRLLRQ